MEDSKFEHFKKLIIEHLGSLDENEKKELKKSLIEAESMQKGGYSVGTIRTWKGKQYIKIAPGKWKPKYNGQTRGAKMAISALKKRADKCTNSNELLQLVLANKSRFSDDSGRPLPFVQELADYVSERNDKIESDKKAAVKTAKLDEDNKRKESKENISKKTESKDKKIVNLNSFKQKMKDKGYTLYREGYSDEHKYTDKGFYFYGKDKPGSSTDFSIKHVGITKKIYDGYKTGNYDKLIESMGYTVGSGYSVEPMRVRTAIENNKYTIIEQPEQSKEKDTEYEERKKNFKLTKEEINNLSNKDWTEYRNGMLRASMKNQMEEQESSNNSNFSETDIKKLENAGYKKDKNGIFYNKELDVGIGAETGYSQSPTGTIQIINYKVYKGGTLKKNKTGRVGMKLGILIDQLNKESDSEKHENRSEAMKGNKNAYKGGFNNVDELKDFALKQYGMEINVSSKKDFEEVQKSFGVVQEMCNAIPGLKEYVKGITYKKLGKNVGGNYSFRDKLIEIGDLGENDRYEKISFNQATTIEAATRHELGHAVQNMIIDTGNEWDKDKSSKDLKQLSKDIVKEALKKIGLNPKHNHVSLHDLVYHEDQNPKTGKIIFNTDDLSDSEKAIIDVSLYAYTDDTEAVPECISDYLTHGDKASKLSKAVYDIVRQRIKDKTEAKPKIGIEAIRDKYVNAKQVKGDEDTITLPDGSELEGTWKLVEADTPTASHNENTFTKTEGFPTNEDGSTINDRDYEHDKAAKEAVLDISSDFDARALGIDNPVVVSEDGVVISGNNRTMSSKLAAKKGTDTKYVEALEKKCKKFGFTPEDVSKFKNPRVVFETKVNGKYSTKQFAKFNQSGKKAQSPVEVAVKVSKTVNANTIENVAEKINQYDTLGELYADNKAMQDVFNTLINDSVIQKTDLPAYYTDEGGVTNNGKEFLETVLIGSVINESNIRSLSSPGGKEIRQKLVRAIVPLIENKGMKGYSINKELNEAVSISIDIKKNKQFANAEEYSKQNVLFGEKADPIAIEFAKKMEGTQKEFAEFMQSLNGGLRPAADGEADIFLGGIESRDDILSRYIHIKKSVWEVLHSIIA